MIDFNMVAASSDMNSSKRGKTYVMSSVPVLSQ
jgi:hypothetical protein